MRTGVFVVAATLMACSGSEHGGEPATGGSTGAGSGGGGIGGVASSGAGGGGSGGVASSGAGSGGTSGGGTSSSGTAGEGAVGLQAPGDCGTTERGNDFEGRPKACVPSGECTALKPPAAKYEPSGTPPELPVGKLVDIGPKPGELQSGAGNAVTMTFDPRNTAILYVGYEFKIGGSPLNGLWKSTDGGSTWNLMAGSDPDPYDCKSDYLDLPINIAIDPNDSRHLYVTEGVRGAGNGFWVSWDGGETWIRAYSEDLTSMSVDPCDFCHVIVGSHGFGPVGVLETKVGGSRFTQHEAPSGWEGGSYGVNFAYDPKSKQGDPNTWLVHNSKMRRTADAGATWTDVSDIGGIHGGTTTYFAADGTLYSGSGTGPIRSSDNGVTWAHSGDGLSPGGVTVGIIGDGTALYAMVDNNPPPQPLMTSPEDDGQNWVPYGSGDLEAPRGMQQPHFDAVSNILYFVNNTSLMAVRVR